MSKSKTSTCRAHCARCGRHFTGTTAFDKHRHHEYGVHPRGGWYGILSASCEPADSDRGLEISAVGECRLGRGVKSGVEIVGLASAARP